MNTTGDKDNDFGWGRRLAPLLVIAVALYWTVFRTEPSVDAVRCDVHTQADDVDVLMLSANWCPYCRRARRLFVEQSINYCEYDIESSAEGRRRYAKSGLGVIPIIHIDDETLVGFNRDEVLQTLAAHDLYPIRDL